MTTQLDFTCGLAKETTYGTGVTVSRFFESEAKMKYNITRIDGKGLRPNKNVKRLNRTSVSRFEGSGDISVEVPTRGFGFLLEMVLGAVTNTQVPATTPALYQQVHTLTKTDPISSYTMQEVLPTLGGGAGQPHTFTGVVADTFSLDAKEGGFLEAKIGVIARALTTATAAAAASYPADDALFTYVHGAIYVGGTVTVPTTTVIAATTAPASANITDFSLSIKRNLDSGGFNLGGAGYRSRKQVLGRADATGKFTAEYTDNTLRDAYLNQTPLALVLTFEHDTPVSGALKPLLQVVIPALKLNGEVPTSDGGNPITQSIDFDVFDNGTAPEPIYFVYRTLDTAV